MFNTKIFIFFSFYFVQISFGQHNPIITNYTTSDYQAHNQNWSISQDMDGNMYFGNSHGLLKFNGNSWQLNKLKSNKIIRSVYACNDRIYTGSYGEIGFWTLDDCQKMVYQNLKAKLPLDIMENEEIWNITSSGDTIFFQSFSLLFAYFSGTLKQIELPGSIMFLHVLDGRRYIQALDFGIYSIDKDLQTIFLANSQFFNDKKVTGILPFSDDENTLLITTNSDGIYLYKNGSIKLWNPAYASYFSEIQVNKPLITKNNDVIIGTIRDGVLIFDMVGNVKYHLNTGNGLQNNTVLSLKEDKYKNIWVGLDKGISVIHISEDILEFKDVTGMIGAVYTSAQTDSILYLGTNQGVYYFELGEPFDPYLNKTFKLVKGTQGQAWHLFKIENTIFCGHNDGSFLISKYKSKKISNVTGGWCNQLINTNGKKFILQGNYTGIAVFNVNKSGISFSHKIAGYSQPIKKLILQGNIIWVAGPNTGLKRLTVDSEFKKVIDIRSFSSIDGIRNPDNIDFNLFKNKLHISDGDNHYFYDSLNDKFLYDKYLNNLPNGYIVRSSGKNDWYRIYNNFTIKMKDSIEVAYLPYSLNKDYHNITNLNNSNYLYCLDDGYLLDRTSIKSIKNDTFDINIFINVTYKNGQCANTTNEKLIEISFKEKDIKIEFWDFKFIKGKKYEYRLLPYSSEWRPTENISNLRFTNLNYGTYSIEIRRNDGKVQSSSFKILQPWYLNTVAKIFYFLILCTLLFIINKYYIKKLKTEKEKYLQENNRLIREHHIQIENQRLQNENLIKNKELANATLHLIQKNETLLEIKEELMAVRKTSEHKLDTEYFQLIMKQINDNLTLQNDKKLFDACFDEVHNAFLKKLKYQHSDLTADDMKLAAYLRMNLTSKEIAPLFNISLRGLENKRYRLRKKMKLDIDLNLTDFFLNFQ